MKKFLFVGDPHAKVSNLDEMEKLITYIENVPERDSFDFILLAGDLFNDHAVVRLEVAAFWKRGIERLRAAYKKVIILVGNHDLAGSKQMETGLSSIHLVARSDSSVMIIDRPTNYMDIALIPYTSSETEFITAAHELYDQGCKDLLIHHQTIDGAVYDNGFYAPNGFNADDIKQKNAVGGHIHTHQEFHSDTTFFFYPGTAMWSTRSDANKKKGIWAIELSEAGMIAATMLSTDEIVIPIVELVVKEGEPLPDVPEGSRVYVELVGTSEWIKSAKEKYRGTASIKTTCKDSRPLSQFKEGTSLEEYLEKFFDTKLVSKKSLLEALKEL